MAFDSGNVKSIFSSTTFWGSIVSLVAMLAPHIYANIAGSASQTAVVSTIVAVVGFVVTVYGRFTATQKVTLTGK
jgi:energy-converting hydrogenase Eha subunit C